MPGDFVRRFLIGLERGFLDCPLFRRASRVHIDGDQRFGRVDDQIAARAQLHLRAIHGVELTFDLVAREQRDAVPVGLHLGAMARNERAHKILGDAVTIIAFD